MRACASLLLGLLLGGCAVSGVLPDWMSEDAAGPEPVNYRFIVANNVGAVIGGKENPLNWRFEIATPHRVDGPRGATWMVCLLYLRPQSTTPRGYYAIFIQKNRILESRLSVVLDHCETEVFTPFDWRAEGDRLLPQ